MKVTIAMPCSLADHSHFSRIIFSNVTVTELSRSIYINLCPRQGGSGFVGALVRNNGNGERERGRGTGDGLREEKRMEQRQ